MYSRTCQLVTSGDLPEGSALRLQVAPSDGFEEAEGMLQDLHVDYSKLVKVVVVPEATGGTSLLVDGAAFRRKERISVRRGKLQGLWGIIRDIHEDSLSLTFERCGGDDFRRGQLVRSFGIPCC
jgi:hypothetical protein